MMLTLTAAEPRRTRLFLARGLLVTAVATATAVLTSVFFVPLLLGVARFKGSLAEADGRYWTVLTVIGACGAVLVGPVALLGYSLANSSGDVRRCDVRSLRRTDRPPQGGRLRPAGPSVRPGR
ncbi:hypothetical protein [Streptomyces cyaneofuscatus]|uniref:hypothetical protein n=1 Tax=Streptomyces cyaneofuscatus TaxID=66883 RepID=UPI0036DF7042